MNGTREQWTTRVAFILAASGSAVGLGNIWRFSYVTGTNGGAAFAHISLAAIVMIGYPLVITEITIGRKNQRNPVGAFLPLAPGTPWWLLGAMGVTAGFVILSLMYGQPMKYAGRPTCRPVKSGWVPGLGY